MSTTQLCIYQLTLDLYEMKTTAFGASNSSLQSLSYIIIARWKRSKAYIVQQPSYGMEAIVYQVSRQQNQCGQVPKIVHIASYTQLAVCKAHSSIKSTLLLGGSGDISSGKFGLLYAQRSNLMGVLVRYSSRVLVPPLLYSAWFYTSQLQS